MKQSPYMKIGFQFDSDLIQVMLGSGFLALRQEQSEFPLSMFVGNIGITPPILNRDSYKINLLAGCSFINGLGDIYGGNFYGLDLSLGFRDHWNIREDVTLDNYILGLCKSGIVSSTQQKDVLIPYKMCIGQKWKLGPFSIQPEFFLEKPEIGGLVRLGLENKVIKSSVQGSYSKSIIDPWNADKISAEADVSLKLGAHLELFASGEYSIKFWPKEPDEKYSGKAGITIKF